LEEATVEVDILEAVGTPVEGVDIPVEVMEVMTLVSHISGLVCFYWSIWVHPKSQVY
jgi:hypothetical protein